MKGNDSKTTARKKHLLESLAPASVPKRVGIFHEASASDTGIDLTNLNLPSSYALKGYTNPSDASIQLLRISYFKNNIKIISSDRGTLTRGQFDVPSNTQINFDGFTANANEIFEIWFETSFIGGATVVEARPLVKSYLLPAGQTDVVVEPFEINKNPLEQIGSVMVFRGPTMNLQFRNSGNATASTFADGNYEEVKGTGGLTSLIRFNVPAAVGGENVVVVSVGSLMERPAQSIISYLENMNGDVDKIRDTVAALSGQPKSNFNGQPQTVDLATFGERFNAILNTEIAIPAFEPEQPYTPTLTNLTLGNGILDFSYSRDREYIEVYGFFQMGSTSVMGTIPRFSFPSGLLPDTTNHNGGQNYGYCYLTDQDNINNRNGGQIRLSSNDMIIIVEFGGNVTATLPFTWATNDSISFSAKIKILGWSSHVTKTLKELAGL